MSKTKFLRQEAHRYKKLGKKWRRPKGLQSKLKKKIKGAGNTPNAGYRTEKKVRYLHPSGKSEVLISNLNQLKDLDNKIVIRIAATVGRKKRKLIQEEAKKMKIRVLNEKVIEEKKKKETKKSGKKESPKAKKKSEKKDEKKEVKKEGTKKEVKKEEIKEQKKEEKPKEEVKK